MFGTSEPTDKEAKNLNHVRYRALCYVCLTHFGFLGVVVGKDAGLTKSDFRSCL